MAQGYLYGEGGMPALSNRNHEAQARLQLSRMPYPLPRLELNPHKWEIDAFLPEDVKLVGYPHHLAIPAPIAV